MTNEMVDFTTFEKHLDEMFKAVDGTTDKLEKLSAHLLVDFEKLKVDVERLNDYNDQLSEEMSMSASANRANLEWATKPERVKIPYGTAERKF